MANIFGFITHPMELGLIALALVVGSAGIGIIVFTIIVRLVLAPLQITQLRNAKAMQRVQPMLAELKKKHGKDRQALSQATMSLYKEHNVNPAMGCLPTLIQFPILIGLFYALLHLGSSPTGWPHAIDWAKSACNGHTVSNMSSWLQACYAISGAPHNTVRIFDLFHADFLWLNKGLGGSDPYYILPLLAGATQWIQSRMMLTQSSDPQQQMMNSMMNFMPLLIIFFAIRYPSGLALYWVTSTLIGIAIQYKITGWGLLAQGGGIPNLARLFVPAGGSSGPKPSGSKPAGTNGNGRSDSNGKTTGGGSDLTDVARPRRKANRARGGRGGRRG